MRQHYLHRSLPIALILALSSCILCGQSTRTGNPASEEASTFAKPPAQFYPETWFHLIGGNVSAPGLSSDLESVAGAGFRGVQVFHGRGSAWPGVSPQIQTLSENWDGLIHHIGEETERLGLDFTMQNCPGWAMSGGPWITPEVAMRHLIWSRTEVQGGRAIRQTLDAPQPSEEEWRDYRDVTVLAFPTPEGSQRDTLRPTQVSSNLPEQPWAALLRGDMAQVEIPVSDRPTEVTLQFASPTVLRTISLPPVEILAKRRNFDPSATLRLEAWVEGAWVTVRNREIPRGNWQDRQPEIPLALAFDDRPAQRFRLTFFNDYPLALPYLHLGGTARVNDWRGQAGFALRSLDYSPAPDQNPAAFVDPDRVIDLSDFLVGDQLDWQAPPGEWTILRFGHVNTGVTNKPAPPEATGFECDKLSPRGAQAHFAGYIGRLTEPSAPVSNSLDGLLIDSWECYTQTWTPSMATDFEQRRSYRLTPWLPALAGYVVDSHDRSEQFLRDWRATISDLLVDNYFGEMARLGKERGLTISFETAAGDVSPGDILQYWSKADVPMCEMWQPNDPHWGGFATKPILPAASAAHIYGKPIVAAEAFTFVGLQWNEHPFMLKHRADQHFTRGLNHLVFHTYTHNPRQDVLPGSSFGGRIGTPFIKGQTWWKYMPKFTDYLARCHLMLQSGQPLADVLLYLGDDLDHKPRPNHEFPNGYKFDYLNFDALINRISVNNGDLVTPEGVRWRVLWLPDYTCQGLLPETLSRVEQLIQEGATVIGGPPRRNPSLVGGADAQVRWNDNVRTLWGKDVPQRGSNKLGKGQLLWGEPLPNILDRLGVAPDVPDTRSINWVHRRTDSTDIYFISADRLAPVDGTLRFRTTGTPTYWDALTGETLPAPIFSRVGPYVQVPIQLPAAGSIFVVFRREEAEPTFTEASLNGRPILSGRIQGAADVGAPYPAFGIERGERPQPWVEPAAPVLSWTDSNRAIAWQNGQFEFERAGGKLPKAVSEVTSQDLSDGWSLHFPPGWEAPDRIDLEELVSWTDLPSKTAWAFSGTAEYRNRFTVAEQQLGRAHLLDLGRVDNLAEIYLNGQLVNQLWGPPFRVDLSPYLKRGENELTVKVTNTWLNRLRYDETLPEAQRLTWTHARPDQDTPPESSGLLGPVKLIVGTVINW